MVEQRKTSFSEFVHESEPLENGYPFQGEDRGSIPLDSSQKLKYYCNTWLDLFSWLVQKRHYASCITQSALTFTAWLAQW